MYNKNNKYVIPMQYRHNLLLLNFNNKNPLNEYN